MSFDPNGVGIANGNIFGFPVNEEEADIVIIPVPWDATASYGKGTSNGPKHILEASTQLDFYHPKLENAFQSKVFMAPISDEWKELNDGLCKKSLEYIEFLEDGGVLEANTYFQGIVNEINEVQNALREQLKVRTADLLKKNKIVAVLGGEHSTPFGLLDALNDHGLPFGVLQIDAHADLRDAYEGFEQSHASIMFNVIAKLPKVKKLVQVGIRDIASSEVDFIVEQKGRIKTFFDWELKDGQFKGETWKTQVDQIIRELPERVYVSFDIDGLSPELCPNTGTPVPGGFKLEEISFLLFELERQGKQIIGFDLNEVAPGPEGDWDANVGARALWQLVCLTEKSLRNRS
jgi:agmatinase